MTWIIAIILNVIDADTFDVRVERTGGPYSTGINANERVRMVNREVNALRPTFLNPYSQNTLIGTRIYCEIHSRSATQQLVVTARPA